MESGSNSPSANQEKQSPGEQYAARLERLNRLQRAAERRGRLFGISKLLIAALTILAAGFLIHHASGLLVLSVPVAAFVVLVVLHEKLIAGIRYRRRAISFWGRPTCCRVATCPGVGSGFGASERDSIHRSRSGS